MPKRRSSEVGGGRTAKRRRRHLYLVLEDWLWGYSIRKVDLSSGSYSDDEPPREHDAAISGDGAERRLPPAVFRVEALTGYPSGFAAAFGTKIIAMTPTILDGPATHPLAPSCVVPVFDIRTRLFAFAPRPKMNLIDPIYFSVGEGLFVLSSGSFQLLPPPPALEEEPGGDLCWEWRELPKHPFNRTRVTSYAVHPDGRTIFVSTSASTFTFDTAKKGRHRKWRRRGRWTLPFTGRAYFDGELDAWVGLHGDPAQIEGICACDVVSSDPGSIDRQRRPAWKLGKEKLLSDDPDEEHVGATLVYMGGRSKYCLVQCVSIDDDCADRKKNFYEFAGDPESDEIRPCRYLLRVTTFSLKFDKHGHLTAGNSQRVRCYIVPPSS